MRLPDPPPPEAVESAVAACRDDPDFTTYPGATDEQIAAAEQRLGVTFPPHYRAFLRASNGMSVLRGRTHCLGVGPDAVVDVVEFNRPDGWLSTLPEGWIGPTDIVWIGVTYAHALKGLDPGPPAAHVSSSLLVRGDKHVYTPFGNLFTRGLSGLQQQGLNGGRDEDALVWRKVVEQVDRVELGEGLILGMDHYLEGRDDPRGARKVRLTTALRLAVDLSADLEHIAEDTRIFGMLPYVDEQGRPRARWMTETEFPDGPPSQVTIDGKTP